MAGDFPGRGGGPQRDRGLLGLLGVLGLRTLGAKVGQGQREGAHVVHPQQNLQGADLLEALLRQGLAGPLDLLDARGEGAEPASCRERTSQPLTSCRSQNSPGSEGFTNVQMHS